MTETEDLVEEELIRQLKEQKNKTGLYPLQSGAKTLYKNNPVNEVQVIDYTN